MNAKVEILGVALLLLCAGCSTKTKSEPEQNPILVESGVVNGHGYVDLGLSVKWATCNVGASSSTECGDYFAWGEISPKDEYTEKNSATYEKKMNSIAGDSIYDAARANWGDTWRMPTQAEIKELKDRCEWTPTTLEEQIGMKVTGPNGNSIFLPAAGRYEGESLVSIGENGFFWSASPNEVDAKYAYDFNFAKVYGFRYYGQSVRPVTE